MTVQCFHPSRVLLAEALAVKPDDDPTTWQQAVVRFKFLHILELALGHLKNVSEKTSGI